MMQLDETIFLYIENGIFLEDTKQLLPWDSSVKELMKIG